MADDPPELEINSEEQVRREYRLDAVGWALRELVGNSLRVMRGAGKPMDLFDQVGELYMALKHLPPKTTVAHINDAMADALAFGLQEKASRDFDYALQDMERGAARMIAARLLGQQVQVTAGRSEFFDAFTRLERIREENRKRSQAATARPPSPPKQKRSRKALTIRPPAPKTPPPSPADEDIDPSAWKTTAEYMRLRRAQLQRQREGQGEA